MSHPLADRFQPEKLLALLYRHANHCARVYYLSPDGELFSHPRISAPAFDSASALPFSPPSRWGGGPVWSWPRRTGSSKITAGSSTCTAKRGGGPRSRSSCPPWSLPALEPTASVGHSDSAGEPEPGSRTILLVDDEAMIREMGRQLLESPGYPPPAATRRSRCNGF